MAFVGLSKSAYLDQVDDLIKAVADEAGLEISTQLASVPTGNGIGTMFNSYTFL